MQPPAPQQDPRYVQPQTLGYVDSPVMGGGPAHAYAQPMPQQQFPQAQVHPGMAQQQHAPQGYGAQYAYPTPHGMQVVQAPAAAMASGETKSRMRWENIVPALALVSFIVLCITLAVTWDDIQAARNGEPAAKTSTERNAAPSTTSDDAAADDAAMDATKELSADEITPLLEKSEEHLAAGRFDDATAVLHPLMAQADDYPAISTLHDRIDAARTKNDELLGTLGRQMQTQKWGLALATLDQIKALRPLTPELRAMKDKARAKLAERQRAEAAAKRPATNARPASVNPAGGGTGSGGAPPTSSPPMTSPPPRPAGANPSGGGIGAPQPGVVAGGGGTTGADCHTHEGVTECH
jgi:hypothetical protein